MYQSRRSLTDHCTLLEELVPLCDDILMDDLLYLLNKCSTLTKLTLENPTTYIPHSKDRDWGEDGWELLRPYGHVMHQIRFATKFPHPQDFADFLSVCPNLRKLVYSEIDNNVHGFILHRAAQSCPLLESLTFDTCSTDAMMELRRNCKKLRLVAIVETSIPLSATDLAIFNQIKTLETLIYLGNDWTTEHLSAISEIQNIKQLSLGCRNHTIFVDGTFADTPLSRSLESIDFRTDFEGRLSPFPTTILSCLAPCNNLREINLNNRFCDDGGLKILAKHFPLLEKIVMGLGCISISKDCVVGLTIFITQHKHLKTVQLCRHKFYGDDRDTTFVNHINDLRSYFPNIKSHYYEYP